MQKVNTNVTVVGYIAQEIERCGKPLSTVALEAGWTSVEALTQIQRGLLKLPINQVESLAEALNSDPAELLHIVLSEYMPESAAVIARVFGERHRGVILNDYEKRVLEAYREITQGIDRDVLISRADWVAIVELDRT